MSDWWPLGLVWQHEGRDVVPAHETVWPRSTDEVVEVVRRCAAEGVPIVPAGGRSGVNGGTRPVHGGVVVDLTELAGIVSIDDESLLVEVRPGTNGEAFETELRRHGYTCGHWPQSMAISTVGGWVACRGAGQLSTRYGKIEDMVAGVEVVLADGTVVRTGGAPRAAVGPDLTQVFVGSEGTLGIVTSVVLRVHPLPAGEWRAAYAFASFEAGLDACRRILRAGGRPAVLRLYDAVEGERNFGTGDVHPLLVLDEAHPAEVAATEAIVVEACAGAVPLDVGLVQRWLDHRNDVSALHALIERGVTLDTMEVAGPWAALPDVYTHCLAALQDVPGMLSVSAHQSHAYLDGACLYFTFAGTRDDRDAFYVEAWDAGQRAALDAGASLSHHHGVGMNRARFVPQALGAGLGVLEALKAALDPQGILNPGKLGLGQAVWP